MLKSLTPATMTLGMFGVVGLLVAAYVAKGLLATEPPKPPVMRNIPVPIADIPAGTIIRPEHLGMLSVETATLESGVLAQRTVIEGRVAKDTLLRTVPILGSQLYEFGTLPPLKVGKDLRAITFDVGGASSFVDALIKPGEYVDVQFRPSNTAGDKRMKGGIVMTLLKGIHVLAINRQTRQNPPEAANTLTLELTPTEAAVLDLAKANGTLLYRYTPDGKGTNELAFADPSQITLEEVLRLPPLPKEPEPVKPFRAQMYRQSSRQELEFESGNKVKDASGTYVPPPPVPNRNADPRLSNPNVVPNPNDAPLNGPATGPMNEPTPQGPLAPSDPSVNKPSRNLRAS